ncbi:hypothetical protein FRB90_005825, partial [Tulasnella sp. 427]
EKHGRHFENAKLATEEGGGQNEGGDERSIRNSQERDSQKSRDIERGSSNETEKEAKKEAQHVEGA